MISLWFPDLAAGAEPAGGKPPASARAARRPFRVLIRILIRIPAVLLLLWVFFPGAGAADRVDLIPRLQTGVTYTDNLYTHPTYEQDEILVTASPGLGLTWRKPTASVRMDYLPVFVRYLREDQYSTTRQDLNITAGMLPDRLTEIQFSSRFYITEDPNDDPENLETTITSESDYAAEAERTRRGRDRYLTGNTFFSFSRRLSRRHAVELAYAMDLLRNEDLYQRNKLIHTPSAGWTWDLLPRRIQVVTEGRYQYTDMESARFDPGYEEERLETNVEARWRLIPGRRELTWGIGYIRGVFHDNTPVEPDTRPDDNWYGQLRPFWACDWKTGRTGVRYSGYYERNLTWRGGGKSDLSDDSRIFRNEIKLSRDLNPWCTAFMDYGLELVVHDGGKDGKDQDYKVHDASVGAIFQIAEDLPLTLELGYLFRDTDWNEDESIVTVNGSLGAWRITKYADIRFSAESGANRDQFGPESLGFGFYSEASARASWRPMRDLDLEIAGKYRRERYRDNEAEGGEVRDDREKTVSLNIRYQWKDWFRWTLGYRYRDVDATEETGNYTDNRFTITADMLPRRPVRLK